MDNANGSTGETNCDGTPSGTEPVMDQNGTVTQQSPCVDPRLCQTCCKPLAFRGDTTADCTAGSSAPPATSATDRFGKMQRRTDRNSCLMPPPEI